MYYCYYYLRTDYPVGEECENVKCGFYATCQMFDLSNNEVNNDVINEVTERGHARCVCPAFCPQVCVDYFVAIFGSGTYLISLLTLLFLFLFGRPFEKLGLRRFKSDQDEIWHDCSWSTGKYTSIDGVVFLICHWPNFKMMMTSFHAKKCCHLVSPQATSARHLCNNVCQFLIYSALYLLYI